MAVSTVAAAPFTVKVVNSSGTGVAGVAVTWTITSGGGGLSNATSVTDANGNATVTYTAGTSTGTATVTATVAGISPVSFTATIGADTGTSTATNCSSATTTTAAVMCAIDAFKATLSSTQLPTFQIAYTQTNAARWSNFPTTFAPRNGLQFGTLSTTQLAAALNVAKVALSDSGYARFQGIRAADSYLATIEPGTFGEKLYYIAVLGTPSATSRWMLQLGGHHYAYNLAFNSTATPGVTTTGTPFHTGNEPQTFTLNGTAYAPLTARKVAMYGMINSLTASQKAAAQLTQTFDDMLLGPGKDNQFPAQQGIVGSSLTTTQQNLVKVAIEQWVQDMPATQAAALRADYEADSSLARTYVAWSKTTDSTVAGSYIRIDGPRVWIEFVIQSGTTIKTQVHVHTVWRDKLRDYGGSLSTASIQAASVGRDLIDTLNHSTSLFAVMPDETLSSP